MLPQVSVVVIFLDAGRFLREAVDSVIAQDFADWELILVDDGSSDGSTEIAREYAAVHPDRIRCLDHPGHANRGMSASRNLGVASCRARLLAFLDSDDVWPPGKLSEQVALMGAHPQAGVIFGQTRFWFGWTGDERDARRDFTWRLDYPTGTVIEPPALLYHAPLGNCLKPSMSNFMVRRDVLDRIGGFEEPFRNLREDYVFWIKVFHEVTVFHAEACWDWCRHHESSHGSISLAPAARREETRRYYQWVLDYFRVRRVSDSYLLSILADFRQRLARPWLYRFLPRHHLGRLYRVYLRILQRGLGGEVRGRIARARRGAW